MDGNWEYVTEVDCQLFVPTPEGDIAEIVKEEVTTHKKTIGIQDCLTGVAVDHLTFIHDSVETWIQHMINGLIGTG